MEIITTSSSLFSFLRDHLDRVLWVGIMFLFMFRHCVTWLLRNWRFLDQISAADPRTLKTQEINCVFWLWRNFSKWICINESLVFAMKLMFSRIFKLLISLYYKFMCLVVWCVMTVNCIIDVKRGQMKGLNIFPPYSSSTQWSFIIRLTPRMLLTWGCVGLYYYPLERLRFAVTQYHSESLWRCSNNLSPLLIPLLRYL